MRQFSRLIFLRGLMGILTAVVMVSPIQAQAPFPPQSLVDATSAQQALQVIGALKPEFSGHLMVDAPAATRPGPYRVRVRSEIPGTSHLVLIRESMNPLNGSPLPQKVVVLAERFAPGAVAAGEVEIVADARQYLTLLAFSRGRWFVASQDVKLGRAAD